MKKRRNLSQRLILALAGTTVGVMAIATGIGTLIFQIRDEATRLGILYILGLATVVISLILFVCITDRLVVRRIRSLTRAVAEISKGNYALTVPPEGRDEIAELSENFNKMTAELQANELLSKDFVRYVSHEFKTPLSVIRSYAEAVQMSGENPETKEYASVMISETDRLAEISKTILELCRLDSTTLVEKKDVFSPAQQIRSVLLATQLQWGEKNISVEPDLKEFQMTGNENLTFRIWQNLIGNAVKFTEENGKIGILLEERAGYLFFRVSDDGVGIADEDKDKIFNLFFTGDRSHNREGSGLGLPLTKKVVEKLGGEISFASERGKGTEFTVKLPLA